MEQSLAAIESLTKLKHCKELPIIVFLNKVDLLEQQLIQKPVATYFPTLPPDADARAVCRYFSDRLISLDQRAEGLFHVFVTSAVNRSTFDRTLERIRPILLGNGHGTPTANGRPMSPEQQTVENLSRLILAADLSPGRTHPKTKSIKSGIPSPQVRAPSPQVRTPSPQVRTLKPFHIPTGSISEPIRPD